MSIVRRVYCMSKKLRQSDAKDIDQPVIKTDIDGHITYLILIETMDGLYTPLLGWSFQMEKVLFQLFF